eukprot:1140557-Pelagomonas_calceolata.AAC.9
MRIFTYNQEKQVDLADLASILCLDGVLASFQIHSLPLSVPVLVSSLALHIPRYTYKTFSPLRQAVKQVNRAPLLMHLGTPATPVSRVELPEWERVTCGPSTPLPSTQTGTHRLNASIKGPPAHPHFSPHKVSLCCQLKQTPITHAHQPKGDPHIKLSCPQCISPGPSIPVSPTQIEINHPYASSAAGCHLSSLCTPTHYR